MTEIEIQATIEAARAELDPISSEIQRLISADGLYTPERREALEMAVARHNAALGAYSRVLATYYDFLLDGRVPPG